MKYVEHWVDRHGVKRWYFRRGRGSRVRLPDPGQEESPAPEFIAAYRQALARTPGSPVAPIADKCRPIQTGIIYFLRRRNRVKIGFATNLVRRISELNTGSDEPLELLLALRAHPQAERKVHRRFAAYRCQGEWFRFEGELKAWIEEKNTITEARILIAA